MSNSLKNRVNKGVLDLKPYEPGKPIEETEKELGLEELELEVSMSHTLEVLTSCQKVRGEFISRVLDQKWNVCPKETI